MFLYTNSLFCSHDFVSQYVLSVDASQICQSETMVLRGRIHHFDEGLPRYRSQVFVAEVNVP